MPHTGRPGMVENSMASPEKGQKDRAIAIYTELQRFLHQRGANRIEDASVGVAGESQQALASTAARAQGVSAAELEQFLTSAWEPPLTAEERAWILTCWPTTEQGANGIVYFSGLPPPQPTRPQPTAVHLQTPPRKSADRLSPRVRSLREHSDGSVSPSKRTGAHMRAADPLSLVSSPLGLSHRLRASISAAEQVHADLMQPLKQEVEEQSPADYKTLDSGGPICKVHGLAVCRACGMDFPVLNSKLGVSAPHDALLTASHASEQNLGKSSVLAESMRADMDLQAQGISGFRPTESSPAIEIPLNSDAVPASNADEWHSTQARVTITVGAARLPSRLLQAWMTEGSCKMRVILSVCTENSDANHAGEAITVESSQPYFGHTFPLHLSALMHKDLYVSIFLIDSIQRQQPIGYLRLPVDEMLARSSHKGWFLLREVGAEAGGEAAMLHLTVDMDGRNHQNPHFSITKTPPLLDRPHQAENPSVTMHVKTDKDFRADHAPSFYAGQQAPAKSAGSGISLILRDQQEQLQIMLQKMVLGQTPPYLPRTVLPTFDDQENTNANLAPAPPSSRLAIQVPYVSPRPADALHREDGPARAQHQLQDLVESNKAAVTALRDGLLSRSGSGGYQSDPSDFLARISMQNPLGRGGGDGEVSLVANSRHFMHESAAFLPSAGRDFIKVKVSVVAARHISLRARDPLQSCDTYCTIVFGKQKCNTDVAYDTCDPRFCESFVFDVPRLSESYFAVTCIHRGRSSERPVGVARVHMRQVRGAPHSCLQGWFELHDTSQSCAPQRVLTGEARGVAAINLEITSIEMSSV